jgi:predicted cation transporter
MVIGLGLILAAVLLGPILVGPIERNIELFFLVAGTLAAAVSGEFGYPLLKTAAYEPLALTAAVFFFGAVVRVIRPVLDRLVEDLLGIVSARSVYFVLVVVLGLISSVITAVIAALVLVEAIALLGLDRKSEIAAVVLACFAIGLGAALTPIGEPLGTIATAALSADFWYLLHLLGPLVIAGIVIVGLITLTLPARRGASLSAVRDVQSWGEIAMRAGKVYIFVVGLVGLSWGLRPLVDMYISRLPASLLFWLNSISAVVDNATLISGGMLIPGNIPNIVAAGRLGISSREWARIGLITGLPLMLVCFAVLHWLG